MTRCGSPAPRPQRHVSVGERRNSLGLHSFDSIMRHLTMFALLLSVLSTLRSTLRTRADLARRSRSTQDALAPESVPPNIPFHVAIPAPVRQMTAGEGQAMGVPKPPVLTLHLAMRTRRNCPISRRFLRIQFRHRTGTTHVLARDHCRPRRRRPIRAPPHLAVTDHGRTR